MPTSTELWHDHLEWAGGLWSGRSLVLVLGLALALAVLALAAYNSRSLVSLRRRAVLLGMRAALLLSLLLVLAQPSWVTKSDRQSGKRIAVVLDRSGSMATGKRGERRWDRAAAAVRSLGERGGTALWAIGDHLEPLRDLRDIARVQPDAAQTDLLTALTSLREQAGQGTLQAVVLVSDGLDTAALSVRNGLGTTALDADSLQRVRDLGVPVHSVHIDDTKPVKDVAVAAVRLSKFGFARTYMPVSVDIEMSGLGDEKGALSLQLRDNGKLVATQAVPIAGLPRRTIELELQPMHVGPHIVQAQLAPLPDEATIANNVAYAGVSVVRDRVRVLHLAGQPSWDTRFLRTHLRANPAIDLVSFYIMVGDGAGAYVAGEDTTLIPFPAKEIFEDSLSGFDLIILHNFPYGPFQLDHYMPQLTRHMRVGGGLLVLGGPLALSAGGYHGTPLADLLPLQLEPPAEDGGWAEGRIVPTLTPLGIGHPLAMLARDPAANEVAWARHRWLGRNTALQAREGASVLVTDASGRALLAVGEVADGRSAVLATGSLWTWAFGADGLEGELTGDQAVPESEATVADARNDYHRLLDQLTAWLVHDPDFDLLRLAVPAEAVPVGQPLRVVATLRDGAGHPIGDAPLKWALVEPGQLTSELKGDQPGPRTDAKGQGSLALPSLTPGAWLLVVEALWQGRPQRATATIVVTAAAAESAHIQPSDRLLQLLAKASGGTVWSNGAPVGPVPVIAHDPNDAVSRADTVHTEVWSRPEVLVWLLLLLCGEWILRRRWGLA